MENTLQNNIKMVRPSIVAIGFNPDPDKITILGSGFIAEGKIITAAHLLNNLQEEQIKTLKANIMVSQSGDLETYQWVPIKLFSEKRNIENDLAIFEFQDQPENLKSLVLGDSDKVEIGQDAYFIGFPYAAQLINDGFGITLVVNRGIISNIKSSVNAGNKRVWFIVDAISNPGNSGCPIIDLKTNEVIGVMSISFRTPSYVFKEVTAKLFPNPVDLDIREPMHIAGAKPINLAKELLI